MAKEIRIDGPIGSFMNDIESFNMELDSLGLSNSETLTLIINSPGGSVIEGWGIYNRLKSLPNQIDIRIEGLAASIASLIALAGTDKPKISEIGSFMIHRASTFAEGDQKDLEKQIETLKTIDETLITAYQAATGKSREIIEEWMDEEKWFTPDEAIEAGFASELINKVDAKMAALYLPKSKAMTKLEKLMNFLNKSDELDAKQSDADKSDELDAKHNDAAKSDELDAEHDDAAKKSEVTLTEEKISEMIASALKPIIESIETLTAATNEAIEVAKEAAPDVAEAAIRKLVKGIKTTGSVPASNTSMDGNGYVITDQKFKDKLKDIETKTRLY